MKLKGTMVLELTDTNTGEVERVEETNMLTNAVNHMRPVMNMMNMCCGMMYSCLSVRT